MHNLSGIFLNEEGTVTLNSNLLYKFIMIYPNKVREYYIDNKSDYKNWVKSIGKAVGFIDVSLKYKITSTIGKGKFGVVKKARKINSDDEVAVKIISKSSMNIDEKEMIIQEMEILKICQHPNIVKLYDIYENHKYVYIFLELCLGNDLFSWFSYRKYRITEEQTVHIIHQILIGLYYLHQYGIIHRDLKPENILLIDSNSEYPLIKITDFGLSKIISPNQTCDEPYGTLNYVSPEILLQKPYDKSVDVWSVGVISYFLLSGKFPFEAKRKEELVEKILLEKPSFSFDLTWKCVSNEGKVFVDSCLQKNPLKRMSLKEALVHSWIKKYDSLTIEKRRRSCFVKESGISDFMLFTNMQI